MPTIESEFADAMRRLAYLRRNNRQETIVADEQFSPLFEIFTQQKLLEYMESKFRRIDFRDYYGPGILFEIKSKDARKIAGLIFLERGFFMNDIVRIGFRRNSEGVIYEFAARIINMTVWP